MATLWLSHLPALRIAPDLRRLRQAAAGRVLLEGMLADFEGEVLQDRELAQLELLQAWKRAVEDTVYISP